MKLNVVSDIHYQPSAYGKFICGPSCTDPIPCDIEFDPHELEPADYLLIAGDLATDDIFEKAIEKVRNETEGKFKDIFFVYGNHDSYNFSHSSETPRKNNYVERDLGDGVVLLGTTLWTPVPKIDEASVVERMNDFRAIPNWNIDSVRSEYTKQSEWLRKKVAHYKGLGKKVVAMTHHNPRIELHPDYRRHEKWLAGQRARGNNVEDCWGYFASYYVTDHSCDDIRPDVWICGHHHTGPVDVVIDGVRFVRNTIGYNGIWYDFYPQIPNGRWYDFVIEV